MKEQMFHILVGLVMVLAIVGCIAWQSAGDPPAVPIVRVELLSAADSCPDDKSHSLNLDTGTRVQMLQSYAPVEKSDAACGQPVE